MELQFQIARLENGRIAKIVQNAETLNEAMSRKRSLQDQYCYNEGVDFAVIDANQLKDILQ